MSTQRFAILAAISTHNLMRNTSDGQHQQQQQQPQLHLHHGRDSLTDQQQLRPPHSGEFHGNVNLLLGAAMLSVVVTMVCFVCYCCHRNLRKRSESMYRQHGGWNEPDANMGIYNIAQCYQLTPEPHAIAADMHQPASLTPSLPASIVQGPPPSYETVVAMDQSMDGCNKCMQIHRNCTYANCPELAAMAAAAAAAAAASAPAAVRSCCCSAAIKLDIELNNNSDECEAAAAADSTAESQILNVMQMSAAQQSVQPVHCTCDLYQTTTPTSASTTTTTTPTCCNPSTAASAASGGHDEHYEFIKKCKHCGCEIDGNYCGCLPASTSTPTESTRPSPTTPMNDNASADNGNPSALIAANGDEQGRRQRRRRTMTGVNNNCTSTGDGNANEPLVSDGELHRAAAQCHANCAGHQLGSSQLSCNQQSNRQQQQLHQQQRDGPNDNINNNGHVVVDLDALNGTGLIRMDMSRIIDQTGLPTYEAALKFESSGYV